MSAHRIDFDETKYMFLLIKDHELLEKYNEIWVKAKNSVGSQYSNTKKRFSVYLFISNSDRFCF